jgi:digeranylgeranylglycerophospholipid reductase
MADKRADVIVVGAGTAGCYFAWRLGMAGFHAVVLEAGTLSSLGKHIGIFHMDKVRFDEFGVPHPTVEELIHTEDIGYTWSPDLQVKVPVQYTFYVMEMAAFIQRMHRYVRESGGEILEHARVEEVILEDGCLTGVKGTVGGKPFTLKAPLVVDASGIEAAIRTRLPAGFGVENDPVTPEKSLFVCLEYRENTGAKFPTGSNSYLFHKAFWNKSYGDGVILGIGQPVSFENAWKLHREWREEYFGDPGKLLYRRQGQIPFRRPPYSLVGNGFIAIGDAACQNKPFSGEGVTSGFTAARIAAEVAIRAIKSGKASKETLWEYNLRYFRGQGAKFAASLAQLPAAAELSRRDVDYLFHAGIIFTSSDFEELNLYYEIQMGFGKLLHTAVILIWGVITGKFSYASLKKFLGASSAAGKIKAHYLVYPENPEGFDSWSSKAAQLWNEGNSGKD